MKKLGFSYFLISPELKVPESSSSFEFLESCKYVKKKKKKSPCMQKVCYVLEFDMNNAGIMNFL